MNILSMVKLDGAINHYSDGFIQNIQRKPETHNNLCLDRGIYSNTSRGL